MSLNFKAGRDLTIMLAPHIRDSLTVKKMMWSVVIALLPANILSVYLYGSPALTFLFAAVLAAVIAELLFELILKRPLTIADGSAVITGLLVAMNTPVEAPLWLPAAGSVFAIIIIKQLFGGLGKNIFNPALSARVFMMIIAMLFLNKWPIYTPGVPAEIFFFSDISSLINLDMFSFINGNYLIFFLILAGGMFLLIRRIITWHIPASFIVTTALFTFIYYNLSYSDYAFRTVFFHLVAGNLVLAAFFMATDTVTSPITLNGKIVFGTGCGILTSVMRLWISFPDGFCFAILLMNAAVPLIDRFTRPRVFGR